MYLSECSPGTLDSRLALDLQGQFLLVDFPTFPEILCSPDHFDVILADGQEQEAKTELFKDSRQGKVLEKMTKRKFHSRQERSQIGSTICKVISKNKSKKICEPASKTTFSGTQVATACINDHSLSPEDFESKGKLSDVFVQIVLKCLYRGRIGRRDIS